MPRGRHPDTLGCGRLVVRPLRRNDEEAWLDLRERNRAWLRPWEATLPDGLADRTMTFSAFVRLDQSQWRAGAAIPMAMEFAGALVGRVAVTGVEWGSARTGSLGYWIDEAHAGRGITTRAVALLTDYAFRIGLHRIEIAARPENESSLRVARKLGFRDEGIRRAYLYVDGDWRDHRVHAFLATDRRVGEFWECDD